MPRRFMSWATRVVPVNRSAAVRTSGISSSSAAMRGRSSRLDPMYLMVTGRAACGAGSARIQPGPGTPLTPATRNLLVLVQLCFGVFPWLGKVAMHAFAPRAVLVWRLGVGALVLLLLAFRRHGRDALPGPRDLFRLFG